MRTRLGRRTFALCAFLLAVLLEDALEPLVYDDLVLVLLDASEAGVGLETGETGVGHGREKETC